MQLSIQNLSLQRGETQVLSNLSLDVGEAEILGLIGPSGCGKSSLLYTIAGLLAPEHVPNRSAIYWDGQDISQTPPHKRGFGLVFQDPLLFPHKNVYENIAFGLKILNWDREKIQGRVAELVDLLDIKGLEKRKVQSLSGGQAQRVSLGRALAPKPKLLMLDEPLAALDATLKDSLSKEIREIIKSQGIPAVYVTHDLREVSFVADQLALMAEGGIHVSGTPEQIRNNPKDTYTANFFGLTNQFVIQEASRGSGELWKLNLGSWDLFAGPFTSTQLVQKKVLVLPAAISLLSEDLPEYVPTMSDTVDLPQNQKHAQNRKRVKVVDSRFLDYGYEVVLELMAKEIAPKTITPEAGLPRLTAFFVDELEQGSEHVITIDPAKTCILP